MRDNGEAACVFAPQCALAHAIINLLVLVLRSCSSNHHSNILIHIHRNQINIFMFSCINPKYFVRKSLTYRSYTIKIKNNVAEFFNSSEQSFGLRTGY